ncbi:MAG: hypothetical protein AB7I04_14305 [Pseudomonadales bacterium]
MRQFDFRHRHKAYHVRITDDGTVELYVDGCLRKDRPVTGREPQYVWTNVELEWEEHHYIEARYWASTDRLRVTVNGDAVFDETASKPAAGNA